MHWNPPFCQEIKQFFISTAVLLMIKHQFNSENEFGNDISLSTYFYRHVILFTNKSLLSVRLRTCKITSVIGTLCN